ncbi:Asp23/Gls24 family envelope stress response protein, partial [Streptomyces cinereoruber]
PVAGNVRENVVNAVERMTGLEVVEVNIAVSDATDRPLPVGDTGIEPVTPSV